MPNQQLKVLDAARRVMVTASKSIIKSSSKAMRLLKDLLEGIEVDASIDDLFVSLLTSLLLPEQRTGFRIHWPITHSLPHSLTLITQSFAH